MSKVNPASRPVNSVKGKQKKNKIKAHKIKLIKRIRYIVRTSSTYISTGATAQIQTNNRYHKGFFVEGGINLLLKLKLAYRYNWGELDDSKPNPSNTKTRFYNHQLRIGLLFGPAKILEAGTILGLEKTNLWTNHFGGFFNIKAPVPLPLPGRLYLLAGTQFTISNTNQFRFGMVVGGGVEF